MFRVLAINPGSTSTKVAVYDDETARFVRTLRHQAGEIAQLGRNRPGELVVVELCPIVVDIHRLGRARRLFVRLRRRRWRWRGGNDG